MIEKVIVINDCAFVMEQLIPFLSKDFDIDFVKRSRGKWSKTFGILWKIYKSKEGMFHVNYGLQDAFLTRKIKHLDVLHLHGSDVRWTLHSKKWGWIVRHNIQKAKKVLYSTPDLETLLDDIRSDATYLPVPVDTEIFSLKQNYSEKPKAITFVLPYEQLPKGLCETFIKVGIPLTILQRNIPFGLMPTLLREYDIFVDRFTIPSFSKTCLEAMSCGLATVDFRHEANIETIVSTLNSCVCRNAGRKNRQYVMDNHQIKDVAEQLKRIWKSVIES
ncbi:hypothetical protein E3J49_06720 [Candidatus Bathyarchaeota archaeon]|nr:MAG: hypothetical protein E3J49_06720 [Candidatus Bathyarchaeota archaeon]